MATYEYKLVPVKKDGQYAYNEATKSWDATETILDTLGKDSWEVVATLDTTFQRQIIMKKTTL